MQWPTEKFYGSSDVTLPVPRDVLWFAMIKKIIKKRQLTCNSDYLDDLNYWRNRSPEERVAAVDFLRKQHHGYSERLQRSVRIIQQKQG